MTRRLGSVTAVGAATAMAVVVAVAAPAGSEEPAAGELAPVAINVDTGPYQMSDGVPASSIPAAIIGGNHRWTEDGKGMWDPSTGSLVGGVDEVARDIGLNLVRYPGGTVANMFDFTRAIGAPEDRRCQTSGGFADDLFASVDSAYGPDENEQYVDAIGGQTMIMVPTIGQTASDAANFVEYMNAEVGADPNDDGVDFAATRAANGHPEPYGITLWEYGNEPYLPNQRYWRSPHADIKLKQFIEGGWQRQTAESAPYTDNDGMFSGCDLGTRVTGNGAPDQTYRVRYPPIAFPADATTESGPIADTVVRVDGVTWTRVANLSNYGANAKVYKIIRATGQVVFGDGTNGKKPPCLERGADGVCDVGSSLSIEYTSGRHDGLLDYYAAMKAVDPSIEVCSGWGKSAFITAMGDRPYDCLGVHMYTSPLGGDADGAFTPAEVYHETIRRGNGPVAELTRYRTELAGHPKEPFLIATEYGTLAKAGPLGDRMPKNYAAMLTHNIYLGELMIGQLENGVQASANSNHNAGPPKCPAAMEPDDCTPAYLESVRAHGELLGSSPKFFVNGRGQLMQLFRTMIGGTAGTTTITGNPKPDGQAYDSLRAASVCADGEVRTLVLNRDIAQTVRADLRIQDAGGARDVTISTLDGPAVNSYSTFADQDVVTTTVDQVTTSGPTLTHEFPAHSVSLLEFIDPTSAGACEVDGAS